MSFARIRPRRGTATQWKTANTILAEGEIGIEVPDEGVGKGTVKIKFGDGATPWNSLPYGIDAVELEETLGEVNEKLATKNLKTYTSLAQIECTSENTISEVMAKLPSNAVLDMGVSTTSNTFTQSLPATTAGRVVMTKQYNVRGVAIYTRFTDGTTWVNPYMDSVFKGWEKVLKSSDTETLSGRYTETYADIPTAVLAVHNSLGNYQSVCKNVSYSTNSALIIGNRFSEERGRYLVLPRTNVVVYVYQIKDGNAYNVSTLATLADLANYALASDVPKIQKGTGTVNIASATTTPAPTQITFEKAYSSAPTVIIDSMYRPFISVSDVTKTGFKVYGQNWDSMTAAEGSYADYVGDASFTWVAIE